MADILAVVTEDARKYWPQFFGGLLGNPATTTTVGVQWDPRIKFFRIGEGGWIDPGTGKVPRTPDAALRDPDAPLLQDLDCIIDPNRALPSQRYIGAGASFSRYYFQKSFVGGDITYVASTTIKFRCELSTSEANDDGFGNNPEFWELGIYSDHPTEAGEYLMVAYGTFPMQTKTGAITLVNNMKIVF